MSGVLLVLALTGCTSAEEQDQQGAVLPHLNAIARQLLQEPGVTCALAVFPDGGTGSSTSTDLALQITVDDLDAPTVPGVLSRAGQLVWDSPLPVSTLDVTANGRGLTEQVRGSAQEFLPLTAEELAQEYGPRPSLPPVLPEIDDPGSQRC